MKWERGETGEKKERRGPLLFTRKGGGSSEINAKNGRSLKRKRLNMRGEFRGVKHLEI